jgi:hypothetical protein
MSAITISKEQLIDMNKKLQDMLDNNKNMLRILSRYEGNPDANNVLTAHESADFFGISYNYFMTNFRKVHNIPTIRKGKTLYFKMSDLVAVREIQN